MWNFKFRLRYHKSEIVKSVSKIQHGPYREIIKYFKLQNENIETEAVVIPMEAWKWD